jgi:poly(A) polymerase
MRFIDVQRMKTSTLKRFLRLDGLEDHLALHRADCLSSHRKLENWEFVRARRADFAEEELRPPRLVNGRDLMKRGWAAGPEMGRELARIEELQLEGKITSRAEALQSLRNPPESGS